MSQLRGSSATRSGKLPARIRSIIAQIPQGRGAPAGSSGAIGILRLDLDKFDARVSEQVGDGVQLVFLFVIDRADAGVDEHLEAVDAGGVRDVNVGVADGAAVAGGLRDRVNLGVNRAVAVLLEIAVGRARFVDETAD